MILKHDTTSHIILQSEMTIYHHNTIKIVINAIVIYLEKNECERKKGKLLGKSLSLWVSCTMPSMVLGAAA